LTNSDDGAMKHARGISQVLQFLIWAGEMYLWSMLAGGVVLTALLAHDRISGYSG
jgi:hypothetical protein